MINSLIIDGSLSSNYFRRLIIIDYQLTWLTFKSFCYLVKLAVARMSGDGWVLKTDIEPGDNQARYIYRMKTEIGRTPVAKHEAPAMPEKQRDVWIIDTETDRNGSYRLLVDPKIISFENHKRMSQLPDASVRKLFL